MDILAGLLGTVAPTIATALLGPAGGIAVKFLGSQLLDKEDAPIANVIEAVKAAPEEKLRDLNKQYENETARLVNEQGEITDTLVDKIDTVTAGRIAWLRMATRPRVVLMMARYIMLPLYVMAIDGALAFINLWLVFFDHPKQVGYLAATFFDTNSTYFSMYQAGVAPAATIVVSYMTLRQIEKSGNPFSGLGDGIAKLFSKK